MSTVGDARSSIQSFLCRNKPDTMFNNSADCVHTYLGIKIWPCGMSYSNYDLMVADGDNRIPCWSVGRLIEIFIICTPFIEIRLRTKLIDQLIASFDDVIKQGLIDFSKLDN